jgi:hypothetical protein
MKLIKEHDMYYAKSKDFNRDTKYCVSL